MDTVEGLRDAARQARECAVIGHAVILARWIGNGRRPVTAGRVLRKADVPAAGAVLGVGVPPRMRTAGLFALLAGFGAVAGDRRKPAITPLGRWAAGHLAAGLAGPADPGLPAGEMIAEAARFGDEEQQGHVARTWLAEREPVQAEREVLAAAEGMAPLRRGVAVRLVEALGDDALPAWREIAQAPCVGPHARAVLAGWDRGPEPGDADWEWLGVEAAAAALEDTGPDEALSRLWDAMPGEDLDDRLAARRATGHPDAGPLARAVADFAASGAVRSIDQVAQLKVAFRGDSPVEYWCEDEPEEPEPFGLNEVNRRLAALDREPA